jgi:hypothetical protein
MKTYLKTKSRKAGLTKNVPAMIMCLLSGALWLWMLSACNLRMRDRIAADSNVITFKWENGENRFRLCAEAGKEVQIFWGDFRKEIFTGDGAIHTLAHAYTRQRNYRVALVGDVTAFMADGSRILSLDASRNSVLTTLQCNRNQLTQLDVTNVAALQTLYCAGNGLTGLDVSRNTALTDLNCSANQLATLHTGEISALKKLDCSRNLLTQLDVSKNGALTELLCNDNALTVLNTDREKPFTRMNIEGNNFPPKELTLVEAVRKKLVGFSANGNSIQSSVINLANLSDEQLNLSIPPGTYLSAHSGNVQNMVITDQYNILLKPKEKTTVHVSSACMNIHRNIPDSDNRFGVAQRPENDLLTKVIAILRSGNYSYAVTQAAVWIVTDGASYGDTGILQRNYQRVIDEEDYRTAQRIVSEARKK